MQCKILESLKLEDEFLWDKSGRMEEFLFSESHCSNPRGNKLMSLCRDAVLAPGSYTVPLSCVYLRQLRWSIVKRTLCIPTSSHRVLIDTGFLIQLE